MNLAFGQPGQIPPGKPGGRIQTVALLAVGTAGPDRSADSIRRLTYRLATSIRSHIRPGRGTVAAGKKYRDDHDDPDRREGYGYADQKQWSVHIRCAAREAVASSSYRSLT